MTDTEPTRTIDAASPESAACCGGATNWIDHDLAVAAANRIGALADPTRLQIVSIIANSPDGEVCACDFVGPARQNRNRRSRIT